MNAFAKYLFQGMFSWLRDAIRQLSDPKMIDSWLATHWLAALIPILLIGTLIDYIVWLIRWRPDLVWRSSINRSGSILNEEGRQLRRFRKGFKDMNVDIGEAARPLEETPAETRQHNEDDAYYDWQFAQPAPAPAPAVAERHRRSDRYRKPARRQKDTSSRGSAADDGATYGGLPPVVSKEQAFRAPVYPHADDQDENP